jgi:hypothetical protein
MSGEIEAVGAAMTAGLVAGAIDGPKPHGEAAHGACANCGAELHGNFCADCGQPAHVHRTLGHMVEEFLHGLLHFDTRAWRTLPMLAFRPGTLTRDYTYGKRARFISPLAIFLLTVFTMFVVFAFSGGASVGVDEPAARGELAAAIQETRADLAAEVRASQREAAVESGPDVAPRAPADEDHAGELSGYEQVAKAAREEQFKIQTGWPDLDKKIKHKLENPELAVYKFQNAAYKFAFLLVPISLPFLWLLFFWKRGLTLFDHTVYILYSLSFVSLLFIVASLVSGLPVLFEWLAPFLMLAIPVHTFFHLKGAYSLGWFSALWRTPVLLTFAAISLLIFLVAILALGFVG